MRPPVHLRFVDKATAAMTSAVEVYNKPSFPYREETFAILALNAWELLLKAKVVKDSGNDMRSIRVYETKKTKAGIPSKKQYLKRNRTGNPHTISITACIASLDRTASKLPVEIKGNLIALTEIRDNSVHYLTASAVLAKQAQQVACAAVRNFVVLSKSWFARDMSTALNLVLPLSFVSGAPEVESVVVSPDESRLIELLRRLAAADSNQESAYAVAVKLEVKIEKSSLATASKVQVSRDPSAVKIALTEADVRTKYPWDYRELCSRLSRRFKDFKQDQKFHGIRKPLLTDDRYTMSRYLDPGNPKSAKKDFYNPNIITEFDAHYTKADA